MEMLRIMDYQRVTLSPLDLIDFARSCLLLGSEAAYRSAISRGYYSMYHKVRESLDYPPCALGNPHAALIHYLANADREPDESMPARDRKRLALLLRQERANRNRVDYELSVRVNKAQAESTLMAAERVVNLCGGKR